MIDQSTKESLMRLAMAEAAKAIQEGNSPFGALIVDAEGEVVGKAYNTTVTDTYPTAHAEINVIRQVAKKFKTKSLKGYTLISNAQSCPMCFCAAVKAKISHFMYGYAEDETLSPKADVFQINSFCEPQNVIETGILEKECREQIAMVRSMKKSS
jgi:tRNA(adenine34) deaminase